MSFYYIHHLKNPWKKYNLSISKKSILYIAGWLHNEDIALLKKAYKEGLLSLKKWLFKQDGHFAFIIVEKNNLFLGTDKVSSFPLFYCDYNNNQIEISSTSSTWIEKNFFNDISNESLEIYQMSGYTIGRTTIRKSVKRVLPGELCTISSYKDSYKVNFKRYYIYYPNFDKININLGFSKLYSKLDKVLNKSIQRLINQANGRTIALSLSSGFDSRLILGKLLELKYKNIICYSYGSKNNFEALEAKKIAKSQNIPWYFISDINAKEKQKYFRNGILNDYFIWSSGLTTTAAMTEFIYLEKLLKIKPELKHAIFTNGQSGDFITGGHLLKINNHYSKNDFLNSFFKKHFSLIKNKEMSMNRKNRIFRNWINSSGLEKMIFSNYYSTWALMEWQERQSYYVVNQQRASDFLNLEWSMPLWDGCLIQFFENIPLEWQLNQKLYSEYLSHWNYGNLFNPLRVPPKSGGNAWFILIIFGQCVNFLFGKSTKEKFYKIFDYFSANNFQYNYFTFYSYFKSYSKIRNAVSLFNQKHYKYLSTKIKNIPKSILD